MKHKNEILESSNAAFFPRKSMEKLFTIKSTILNYLEISTVGIIHKVHVSVVYDFHICVVVWVGAVILSCSVSCFKDKVTQVYM